MMIGNVLLLLNIGLGFISSLPTSGRLIISAIVIWIYNIARYKKHCEKPVFILTLFYGLRSFSLLVANSVFQYVNNSVSLAVCPECFNVIQIPACRAKSCQTKLKCKWRVM